MFKKIPGHPKRANIWNIGMPEGEEEEQEIENLFKEIVKENLPNLVKEIYIQVQEAQSVPNKMDTKRSTLRHIIIKMPEVKDKERISKVARGKQSYLQRSSHKTISWFLKRNFAGKKGLASFESVEKQGPTIQITLSHKAII